VVVKIQRGCSAGGFVQLGGEPFYTLECWPPVVTIMKMSIPDVALGYIVDFAIVLLIWQKGSARKLKQGLTIHLH